MLHFATLGRQKAVREFPRINRCGRQAFGKRLGRQLGPGIRKADAEIQSRSHFIRVGLSHHTDHLVIHGCARFLCIESSGRLVQKSPLGAVKEWD